MGALSPYVPTVVVDSNAIVQRAWYLDSTEWRVLLDRVRIGYLKLVVPELVVIEVVGRFRSTLEKEVPSTSRGVGLLSAMLPESVPKLPWIEADKEADQYDARLRQLLADSCVDVPAASSLDMRPVLQRATERRRPIDDKGHNIRDAMLWQLVLDTAAATEGPVYLVTDDSDFYEKDGEERKPHPDLVADVEQLAGPVELVSSIAAVLAKTGVENPELHSQVMRRLGEDHEKVVEKLAQRLVGSEILHPTVRVSATVADVADLEVDLTGVTVGGGEDNVAFVQLSIRFTAALTARVLGDASPQAIEARVRALATATFTEEASFDAFDVVLPGVREIPELAVLNRVSAPLLLQLDDVLKPYQEKLAEAANAATAISAQQLQSFSEILDGMPIFTREQSEALGSAMLSSGLADAAASASAELGRVYDAWGGKLAFDRYLRRVYQQLHRADDDEASGSPDNDEASE